MNVGIIGLGKMGGAIAKRFASLIPIGVYDINLNIRQEFKSLGIKVYESIEDLSAISDIIWIMVQADHVDDVLNQLCSCIKHGTIIIDGGNSFFKDSIRRAEELKKKTIEFLDCGTSGGLFGALHGFSLTIGGSIETFTKVESIFKLLSATGCSYAHVGPSGAGHYVKMVHNGIEYALMESYAEGFNLLHGGYFKNLNLGTISDVWFHGSIVQSWLLKLITEILNEDQSFDNIKGIIGETGMGRWTVKEAHKEHVPVPLIEEALKIRLDSSNNTESWSNKFVALLRHKMGGHKVEQNKCPFCQEIDKI